MQAKIDNELFKTLQQVALLMSERRPTGENDGEVPTIILPGEKNEGVIDTLERYLPNPVRQKVAVTMKRAESFINYVNEHKTKHTRVFADTLGNNAILRCEIDYHEAKGKASWRTHRVELLMVHSEEWKLWTNHNLAKMSQVGLATFIEENLMDIVNPDPAALLEVVQEFKASSKGHFSSDVNLTNRDIQFSYSKTTTTGETTRHGIEVPETFTIEIPVFDGGEKVKIDAWFRYNVNHEGELTLHYKMKRPDKIRKGCIDLALEEIGEQIKVPIFYGTVEG